MKTPETIDDLTELYQVEFLEEKGQFIRVSTDLEESVWYCDLCGSLDVDAHEGVCYNCGEDDEFS